MYLKKTKNPNDGASNTRLIPQSLKGIHSSNSSLSKSPKGFGESQFSQSESLNNSGLFVHLDALSLKGVSPDLKTFHRLVDFICSIPENRMEYRYSESPFYDGGNEFFDNKVQFTHGCVGGFNLQEDRSITYCLKLLGEYFENCTLINVWRCIRGLKNTYSCECTRFDCAIDDYLYEVIPVDEMVHSDSVGHRMFYKKYKNLTERDHTGRYRSTHYFGSRSSGKMVRVYLHADKCLRFETEFKRQYARKIFDTIASIERSDDYNLKQELMKTLAGLAIGAIDFRDTSSRKNSQKASVKDTQRLEFWQKFIDLCGKELRVRLPKVPKTIEKVKQWINYQVGATLAALKKGMGSNQFNRYLDDVLFQGSKKFKIKHELLIEVIQCSLNDLPTTLKQAKESGLIC